MTCFFVDRQYRRRGLSVDLLEAAVQYASANGARVVEGYPVESTAVSYTYMGSPETFIRAGFSDVTPSGRERRMFRIILSNIAATQGR